MQKNFRFGILRLSSEPAGLVVLAVALMMPRCHMLTFDLSFECTAVYYAVLTFGCSCWFANVSGW